MPAPTYKAERRDDGIYLVWHQKDFHGQEGRYARLIGSEDDARRLARSLLQAIMFECTDWSADYCPKCGSCRCEVPDDAGDRTTHLGEPGCALHGTETEHAS